jgi:hypothetical protein
MRLNFKKVSAIAASALMVGLTMGVAAAANYPSPFVAGGGADVAIVYGTGAGVSSLDIVQAGNLEANLQSYLSGGGGSSATSVSGGDYKVLSTSTRKLYYGDSINAPITSLTYTELPNVLASGTVTDLSGTAYGYTQIIQVGPAAITFGTSGGDLNDPVLYIDATTTAGTLYNYTLSFTKSINVSDATNVQGQKIKILGVDYVIGADSTNTTLYLYGSGTTVTVNGGESQTVNIGGTDHTVELVTTAASSATIKVDGVSKTVTKSNNYAFAGGVNVYVKDIINPQYAGDLRQVELIVGASSLKIVNGQTVKKGADEISIQGTSAEVTAAGYGVISGFTVEIAAAKSQTDSIALGDSFTDPVFGGLKLTLANVVPTLDSAARGVIIADAGSSNTQSAYVTFTSARAGSAGEQKLMYVYDNNTAIDATQPLLAHSTQPSANGKGIIHVLEGENAVLNDWIVVNQGDAGTILQVDSLDDKGDGLSGTVTLSDVITGESQTITLTNGVGGYTALVNAWGGTGYTVSVPAAWDTVNITWNSAGTKTLFPRIKLANGGWLAFLTQTTIPNSTYVILPDGVTTLSASGSLIAEDTNFVAGDGIDWGIDNSTTGTFVNISQGTSSTDCNFNATLGPALLYIEPKKWDDSTYGNYICIPLTYTGSRQIAMGDPLFNGTNSGWITLGSDTFKKEAVDKYGVFATKEDRTNQNGLATLYYPSSQMYFDVVFSSESASVTGTTTTVSGTQLGDVLVKDSEVSSVSGKNLIVVGGSCINTVASTLLGGAGCGEDFTDKTGVGSGQFLIQSLSSTYSSGKIALIVAGYEVADTVNAATYLRTQTVDTSVGKKYKGTSATSAELVTTSS